MYKAVPVEWSEVEKLLKEYGIDSETVWKKIEDGGKAVVGDYYIYEESPLNGLCIGLKFPLVQKYIKVYEGLDATYMFQHKECEVVGNCREHIDMLIRMYKLTDRIPDDIEIKIITLSEKCD